MDLVKAEQLAIELMNKHNLIDNGWQFEFDNAKRRFGGCNYTWKKITLSKHLVQLNDEFQVKDTILHEIAHALVGHKHGHDSYWRMKAREIGCNGERCYSSDLPKPTPNYIGTCPNGHEFKRLRLSLSTRKGSCTKCDKKYNPNFLLVWKKINHEYDPNMER